MRRLPILLITLLWSASAYAADPVGRYQVEGGSPGSTATYRGTVTVQKMDQIYQVIWEIGATTFVGTGIETNDFFAAPFAGSGKDHGLAVYSPNGSNWAGVWIYADGRYIGWETWKRQ